MAFSISHTVSTLNQYNPSSRALGIILVSRVDTDAILKKPYDILYIFYGVWVKLNKGPKRGQNKHFCSFKTINWSYLSLSRMVVESPKTNAL